MSLCLFLDTSSSLAQFLLVKDSVLVNQRQHTQQKEYSREIHLMVDEMLRESGFVFTDLSEIWVMNGPGSYTGLRISLAFAKGICYGLKIPLYVINRFDWMISSWETNGGTSGGIFVIQSRMDEYFVKECKTVETSENTPLYLTENEIVQTYSGKLILFTQQEWTNVSILSHSIELTHEGLLKIINGEKEKYLANLLTSEPFYFKSVYINKINKL